MNWPSTFKASATSLVMHPSQSFLKHDTQNYKEQESKKDCCPYGGFVHVLLHRATVAVLEVMIPKIGEQFIYLPLFPYLMQLEFQGHSICWCCGSFVKCDVTPSLACLKQRE